MLRSMTAFGRANVATSVARFIVEIQSVNRKYLEVLIALPKELTRFDPNIRKWVRSIAGRGQVTVRVTAMYEAQAPFTVQPNIALASQFKQACEKLGKELGVESNVTLETMISQPGVLLVEEELPNESVFLDALKKAFDAACVDFNQMKVVEGKALESDIRERLKLLDEWINEIEAKAPDVSVRFQDKLKERLSEYFSDSPENEEAILREIVIYATKVDVTEEIVRFKSHLVQFNSLLEKVSGASGKSLDFLLQELNREANTIASKASDSAIAHRVVDIKTELDRIREQVQNVE